MLDPKRLPILARVDSPDDLKALSVEELESLCGELRTYVWETITHVGGHLSPSLGVVELTVALHKVFASPRDKIVWDVGHQSYIHKVLTGRRDQLPTIRQFGGLSGFCKRKESPHDAFGAGHASTAISSALGIATARDLRGEDYNVVAVVGDGGMTGGLSYEGLNNAGASGRRIVVILNDNKMSISPNVGAISRYLTNILSSPLYNRAKVEVWQLSEHFPKTDIFRKLVRRIEESLKSLLIPGMLFEDLGFRYFGPIDGHDLKKVLSVLDRIKTLDGPVLLHLVTTKGKGIAQAEGDPLKYHGVQAIARENGKVEAPPAKPTYTDVFSHMACHLARDDDAVVGVTAAMAEGTGLVRLGRAFPERFFDVGIAEAHAVTFSGGMAAEGLKPIAAIYSTFLQRAYDQIVHDVALQNLPVLFCLDRAGLVGEDGPTHHGSFDLSYLNSVPGMVVAAPKDGRELCDLMYTGVRHDDGPFAIRYPRATIPDEVDLASLSRMKMQRIPIGSWEWMLPGESVVLLAVGSMVAIAVECAQRMMRPGFSVGVINCRFVKPLDEELLTELLRTVPRIVTLEEGSLSGGFASTVGQFSRTVNGSAELLHLGLPDSFVEHGKRALLLDRMGLSCDAIRSRIASWCRVDPGRREPTSTALTARPARDR